jgi:DNA-binding SARP family transcriptional activator
MKTMRVFVTVEGKDFLLPAKQAEVLRALMVLPKPVYSDALIAAVWPAKGPRYAKNNLHVHLAKVRDFLRPHGFEIRYSEADGYCVARHL